MFYTSYLIVASAGQVVDSYVLVTKKWLLNFGQNGTIC